MTLREMNLDNNINDQISPKVRAQLAEAVKSILKPLLSTKCPGNIIIKWTSDGDFLQVNATDAIARMTPNEADDSRKIRLREYHREYHKRRCEYDPKYKEHVAELKRNWEKRLYEENPDKAEERRKLREQSLQKIKKKIMNEKYVKRLYDSVHLLVPKFPHADKLGSLADYISRIDKMLQTYVDVDGGVHKRIIDVLTEGGTGGRGGKKMETVIRAAIYREAITKAECPLMAMKLPGISKPVTDTISEMNSLLSAKVP